MKTTEQKIRYHIEMIRRAIEEEPNQTLEMYHIYNQMCATHEMMTGKTLKRADVCIICPHCGKKVNK